MTTTINVNKRALTLRKTFSHINVIHTLSKLKSLCNWCKPCFYRNSPWRREIIMHTEVMFVLLQCISTYTEGDTPSPLAYCVPLYCGIAYCVPPFLASRTAYHLTTKNNHFGRFHLHKEVKITVCCMHIYSNKVIWLCMSCVLCFLMKIGPF